MYSPSHAKEPDRGSRTKDGESATQDHEQQQQAHRSNSNSHDGGDSHASKEETSSSSNTTQLQHGESTTSSEEADDPALSQTLDPSQIPTYIEREADIKLLKAAREGNVETLREAIRDGASLKAKTFMEETALHLACRFGHEDVIKQILSILPERPIMEWLQAQEIFGLTPLQWTCYQNNNHTEEIVKLLLGYSNLFDINAQNSSNGYTALHFACFDGSEKAIKLLLDAGAKANIHDHHNSTPLTMACQFMSAKAVGMLLKAGAQVNDEDNDKDTPLILAAEFGDVAMIRKLLEYNPTGDCVNKAGQNAMHHAMANKARDEIVPLLLNEGIPLGKKKADELFSQAAGKNSTDNPLESMWLEIVQTILKEHTPKADKKKLFKAIKPLLKFASKEEKVFALLKAGEDAHFDVLSDLTTKELGLRKDLCKIIRSPAPFPESYDSQHLVPLNAAHDSKRQFPSGFASGSRNLVPKKDMHRTKEQHRPKSKLQLSAQHGEYLLVWYLLKTLQPREEDDIPIAIKIAKDRRRETAKDAKPTESSPDKVGLGRSKDAAPEKPKSRKSSTNNEDSKRYELTIDILQNATALVRLSNKLPRGPKPGEMRDKESLLQQYHATIVDFYQRSGGRDGQTDLLQASPSVFDLIYADDDSKVDGIMNRAKSTFNEMIRKKENEKIYDEEKPQLRWIHLPANHMDWMEHLTMRVYSERPSESLDKRQAFFDLVQRSRVELPTTESKIKFLKPICLKEELPQRSKDLRLGSGKPDPQQDKNLKISTSKNEDAKNDDTRDSDLKADDMKGGDSKSDATKDNELKPGNLGDSNLEGSTPEDSSRKNDHQRVDHTESRATSTAAAGRTARQRKTKESLETSKEKSRAPQRLALYTPYITFGYCDMSDLAKPEKKHTELKEKYTRSILHGPRSLDRFYYNALSDDKMTDRDRSQVVTRGLLKKSLVAEGMVAKGQEKWPYLTVDQLWVWVINDKTIISSSTHREDGFDDLFVDRIIDQLRKGSTMGSGQKAPSSAIEMSHFLLGSCVDFINSLTWKDVCRGADDQIQKDASSKPVLLFYADSLNKAMATEKDLFQDFKARIKGEKEMARARAQGKHEPASQQASDASKALDQDTKDWTAINTAATLLDEVKDIRDELVILRFLVARQENVWNGLMDSTSNSHDARSPSFTANELDEMIKTTEAIQKSINDLLSLEENSIDIKESMMSRKQSATLVDLGNKADQQSEENSRQEKILMLFTVVTVVFTPLSFLASFYALNTSTSRHNDDGELEYEPEWMNERIYGISAAIVVPLLIYAFFGEIKMVSAQIKEVSSQIWWLIQSIPMIWHLSRLIRRIAKNEADGADIGEYVKSHDRQGHDLKLEEGRLGDHHQ